jgi:hypothetical protein
MENDNNVVRNIDFEKVANLNKKFVLKNIELKTKVMEDMIDQKVLDKSKYKYYDMLYL